MVLNITKDTLFNFWIYFFVRFKIDFFNGGSKSTRSTTVLVIGLFFLYNLL